MSLWPFRTGDDDRYQTSLGASVGGQQSIYDPIQDEQHRPPHRYSVEVSNYVEWRWRRGFLASVFPTTCYSACAGFAVGFRQSRVEGRYIGRYKVMWRYTSSFAAVGLLTTAIHHFLVVRNHYHDTIYYPIIAGTAGSVMLTVASQMGSASQGAFVGSFIGVLYALGCYGMSYYHKRHLNIFLAQQQLQQVPIHKVSLELQPMYRAYLYDHRPLEERAIERREAAVLSRAEEDDRRLDAEAFMANMSPEIFDWVNFPDWWPLKWPMQTEEDQALMERQRTDEVARRVTSYLETEDGGLLKRRNRIGKYRDE